MSFLRFFGSKDSNKSCDDEFISADEEEYSGEEEEEQEQQNEIADTNIIIDNDASKKLSQDNPLLPEELCELPTFVNTANCDKELIELTRKKLTKKYNKRPECFHKEDYDLMCNDDWSVSRFLLRCRLDVKRSARLMEQFAKFRKDYRMGQSKMSDFPLEFHKSSGVFHYAPDRVGNETLYMRVRNHRRASELSQLLKEYLLCVLEHCDRANNGRGTAIIFDLTDCGLQNIDIGFLYWLVSSFRNYCPKGLSYIVVYNLPWMLSATSRLALSWMSATNRRRLRFVSGEDIKTFIAPENLPDYMGGLCELSYRLVPKGAVSFEEHHLTKEHSKKLRGIYAKLLKEIDDEDNRANFSDHKSPASFISSSIIAS